MSFIRIEEFPPKNSGYRKVYNTLLQECWKRGIGLKLEPKKEGDSVLQSDLDKIRGEILKEREYFFVPEQLELSLSDPFKELSARPELNDGKGFLLMPHTYTDIGCDAFRNDASLDRENVPVLFEHFQDLEKILKSLRFRRFDYRLNFNLFRDKLVLRTVFLRGEEGECEPDQEFHENEKRVFDTRKLNYKAVPLGKGAEVYYGVYRRIDSGNWEKLDDDAISRTDQIDIDIEKLAQCVPYTTPTENAWGGSCVLQPVIEIISDFTVEPTGAGVDDDESNGVAVVGNCIPCCDAAANKYTYLKETLGHYFCKVKEPLATSSAETGLVIGHYLWTYTCDGKEYGQYNCDTRIENTFTGSHEGEDGTIVNWEFCEVRRPTGALVLFPLLGSAAGIPSNKFAYRMRKVEKDIYSIRFDDQIEQRFERRELQSCRLEAEEANYTSTIPGKGVERDEEPAGTYRFSSKAFPTLSFKVNSRGVPSEILIEPPAAGTRQAAYDAIASIRTGSSLEDAQGFDFADFYLPGQLPDFGTPETAYTMEFRNAADELIGKFVELRHAGGIVAKGFWNREEGVLQPTELSVFERSAADEDGNFLETRNSVKYGLEGRSEAIFRVKKHRYANRENEVQEYRDYGTANERHALFSYGNNPLAAGYGKLTFYSGFDGEWRKCEYDAEGRLVREITPFMDSGPGESDEKHNVTLYLYEPLHPDEVVREHDMRARTVIRRALGQEVGRSYHLYFPGETREITAAAPEAPYHAPGNRVTRRYSYVDGAFAGRTWKVENPDGSSSLVTYQMEGNHLTTTVESGRLPDHGTRTVTTTDSRNHVISSRSYDIETGLLTSGNDYTYDRHGRVLTSRTIDGDVTTTEYNCCGPRFVTQPDGSVTEYAYDVFNRLKFESAAGITTFHTYDANDNEIRTTVTGKDGGELATSREYDADGMLQKETAPTGAETLYARGSAWEQLTDALGGTQRTEYYRDGSVKSVSGSAATPVQYRYGVLSNEKVGMQTNPPFGQAQSFTDFLGQQYRTLYPDNFSETTLFDAFGRPVANENSDGLRQLTVYDSGSGKVRYQVVKRLDASGEIDWQHDSITQFSSGHFERGGKIYSFSESSAFLNGAFTVLSRSESRRDGKESIQTANGQTSSHTVQFEGDGIVKSVSTAFDGTMQTEVSENGLLQSTLHSVLGETTYSYDQFNRQNGSRHTIGGTATEQRSTLDAAGNILTQTEQAGSQQRTAVHTYDLLGRQLSSTTPEGIRTVSTYTARGELATVSGGVYRQSHEYNAQGQPLRLVTYRNADAPEETVFEYDDRGRRIRKTYADSTFESWTWRGDGRMASHTNVRGQTLTYTYNSAGELVAAQGAGLQFEYDSNGRVTQLTDLAGTRSFVYDDYGKVLEETVPNVSGIRLRRSYDNLQRPAGLSLTGTKYLYLCYGEDAIRCIRRISETDTSIALEFTMGAWEEREHLAYQPLNTLFELDGVRYDDFGRPETHPDFTLKKAAPTPYLADEHPTPGEADWSCSYGDDGRVRRIETAGNTLQYAYLPGSGLVASRSRIDANAAEFLKEEYIYDHYQRLTRIDLNSVPATAYALNDDDQRMRTTLPDGSVWSYAYDTLGQLTGAVRDTENDAAYSYDGIGNRLTATEDGAETNYTANQLNQYAQINAESPTYDADGNMLTNAGWTYTWNSENRLVKAVKGTVKLEFAYDFMGRRVFKKVYGNNALTKYEKYVYDYYKLVAVCDGLNGDVLTKSFVWQPDSTGLDVPLVMTYGGESFHFVTDGNKNVVKLLRADQSEAASYTYAPFGGILAQSGDLAAINPFRFSSEFHDDETGLVYYNYRYYDPKLGRWTRRDPIEEEGGINSYVIVNNNLETYYDSLGLAEAGNSILAETTNCTCGVDITDAVNKLLHNLSQVSGEFYRKKLRNSMKYWVYDFGAGWDIQEFMVSGRTPDSSLFNGQTCGQGDSCKNTVTLWGGCFKVWAVNYLLWGKITQMAGLPLSRAKSLVKTYRTLKYISNDENESIKLGTQSRLFFTEVGYNKSSFNLSHNANYTTCNLCSEKYERQLTARIEIADSIYDEFSNKYSGYKTVNYKNNAKQ